MSNEPVMVWGTLGTLVGALLMAMMQQFMPDIGNELMTAIVELVVFLVPILGGLWYARSKVTPVSNPKNEFGERLEAVNMKPYTDGPL